MYVGFKILIIESTPISVFLTQMEHPVKRGDTIHDSYRDAKPLRKIHCK